MRIVHLAVAAAALVGGVLFSGPAAAQAPAAGGCYAGSELTITQGPRDTESGTMSSCGSPLLPGVSGGLLTIYYSPLPFAGLFGVPYPQATGNVAWSNGQQSTLAGVFNTNGTATNSFAITGGAAAGHHLVVTTSQSKKNIYRLVSALLAP
ncbi:hypothetical protein [Nocardia alni]|uniref:hypothetical protein n=1 Tax=Nocardia alni TaxID=2815723 RepID=UPI001C23ED34|nr:hypothetical protein [Nocardia alni]